MLSIFQKYVKQHTFYFGIIFKKIVTLQCKKKRDQNLFYLKTYY